MNANESRYCICVVLGLHHGNLNLDTYNSLPFPPLCESRTNPPHGRWCSPVVRQSDMPNRMWRYNGSGISGFTQAAPKRELRRKCRRLLEIALRYPPLFVCKKDAASWIRNRTIDQTNTGGINLWACDTITIIIMPEGWHVTNNYSWKIRGRTEISWNYVSTQLIIKERVKNIFIIFNEIKCERYCKSD